MFGKTDACPEIRRNLLLIPPPGETFPESTIDEGGLHPLARNVPDLNRGYPSNLSLPAANDVSGTPKGVGLK